MDRVVFWAEYWHDSWCSVRSKKGEKKTWDEFENQAICILSGDGEIYCMSWLIILMSVPILPLFPWLMMRYVDSSWFLFSHSDRIQKYRHIRKCGNLWKHFQIKYSWSRMRMAWIKYSKEIMLFSWNPRCLIIWFRGTVTWLKWVDSWIPRDMASQLPWVSTLCGYSNYYIHMT